MRLAVCLVCLSPLISAQPLVPKQVIAGPGDPGDNGVASSSWLHYPEATASDSLGNLFISDAVCGCIRRVGSDGMIQTIAGGGHTFPRDGVAAADASLGSIYGVAIGPNGLLYFSSTNNKVFMIDPGGRLQTAAGTGVRGGNGDGGPATQAQLDLPWSLAFGPDGGLYIAERNGYRIRRVAPDGAIDTVAGAGTPGLAGDGGPAVQAQLQFVNDIAVDPAGNLYIHDACRIRRVTTDGLIATIAGSTCGYFGDGGPATLAKLEGNSGIAVDPNGNIYIAEPSRRIRMIGPDGRISTIAGTGSFGVPDEGAPALQSSFGFPYRISIDAAGTLYVSDLHNKRVFRIDATRTVSTAAGSENPLDGGWAIDARLNSPVLAIADAQSNVYLADAWAGLIHKIAPDGSITAIAGKGNHGTIGDGMGGPGTGARIGYPHALALDTAGNLFIGADQADFRILKLTPDGIITTVAGNGIYGYSGDGGPAAKARVGGIGGIAFDAAGNLYFSDYLNNAIRRISPDGMISTIAGGRQGYSGDGGPAAKAQLNNPQGLAFDPQGNLLIADQGNNRVRKIAPDGIISTVAGDGRPALAGDGGPATLASLSPFSVAADALGNIFIADSNNNRARWIGSDGIIHSLGAVGSAAHLSLAPDGTLLLVEGVWGLVSRVML